MARIVAARADRALWELPWSTALEDWSEQHLVTLPRGISRHIVRFVRHTGHVYALKEVNERLAFREYRLLRDLGRLGEPAVEPVGVVTERSNVDGEPLDAMLVTRHLTYSLPYRAVFSQALRADTLHRLCDALVVLLVRLHLAGFFWGDCSLSNTLFRRSAGAFAAYLVDAETGELHSTLSNGQRQHDLETTTVNLYGELLDLRAGNLLGDELDPGDTVSHIADRYAALWAELTDPEEFGSGESHRIEARIRRLNDLGFDVDELDIITDIDGSRIHIQPKVVDAGHHSRRLLRLTGLDVEEYQAQRLLNDLDSFRAATQQQGEDLAIVAHQWLVEVFEPVVRLVPPDQRGKLEPAEIFHEVLEHRWYLSEREGREVPLLTAAQSYVDDVLRAKPDANDPLPDEDA